MGQESRHSLAGSSAQGLTRLHSLVEFRVLYQSLVVVGQIHFLVVLGLSSLGFSMTVGWRPLLGPKNRPQFPAMWLSLGAVTIWLFQDQQEISLC